jgi:hypothetical protein
LPDELTIRSGDVIAKVKQMDGGWWEGTSKGKRGLFPDNFVKVRKKARKQFFVYRQVCQYVSVRNTCLMSIGFKVCYVTG